MDIQLQYILVSALQGPVVRRSDSTIHRIANFSTIVKMLKTLQNYGYEPHN